MGHKSYSMVALLTTQVANLTDALNVSQEINQRQIDQMDGFQQELLAMEANHSSHLEYSQEQQQIIEAQKEIVAEHQQRFLDLEAKLKNTQFELSAMTDQCLANDNHAAMEYTPPTTEEEINCATEMTKRLVSLEILQHLKKKNISVSTKHGKFEVPTDVEQLPPSLCKPKHNGKANPFWGAAYQRARRDVKKNLETLQA